MPIKYIHDPWTAPDNVQKAAKCIIGKDYPVPMINHALVTKINIQRMKQVYRQLKNYQNVESYDGYGSPLSGICKSNCQYENTFSDVN